MRLLRSSPVLSLPLLPLLLIPLLLLTAGCPNTGDDDSSGGRARLRPLPSVADCLATLGRLLPGGTKGWRAPRWAWALPLSAALVLGRGLPKHRR